MNPEKAIRTMPCALRTLATRSTISRRAFSLIELLTVLAIIAIVLAIVIPVLASGRNAARKAATQGLLSEIGAAISQFQISERRLPGYFSAQDMASTANNTNGDFSEMENMMLELAGGVVTSPVDEGNGDPALWPGDPPLPGGPKVISVGPVSSKKVNLSIELLGSPKQDTSGATRGTYFRFDRKFFAKQALQGNRPGTPASQVSKFANPVVVDAWGQPVLAWKLSPGVNETAPLVAEDSGTKAQFYWGSNSSFLRATRLGKIGANQIERSLLGSNISLASRLTTLRTLVGSPAFPSKTDATMPGTFRAPVLLHSAGPNGIFLDRDSRGGRSSGTALSITYTAGKEKITDGSFEDVTYTAGN